MVVIFAAIMVVIVAAIMTVTCRLVAAIMMPRVVTRLGLRAAPVEVVNERFPMMCIPMSMW